MNFVSVKCFLLVYFSPTKIYNFSCDELEEIYLSPDYNQNEFKYLISELKENIVIFVSFSNFFH
jgi:hypothetical protein